MSFSQQTYVITGATSGIGLEITRGLLKARKQVIMIVRSSTLAEQRIKEFKQQIPRCQISYFVDDLSSQNQVETVANQVLSTCDKIHVLINNAGLFMSSHQLSEDGIELTFAVNQVTGYPF